MSASTEPLPLAGDFPVPSRDEWRALVSAVLAKSGISDTEDPERALASTTYDGIELRPLYTRDDAPALSAVPAPRWAGWDVRQRVADTDAARGNAAALQDLASGATSLWLVLGEGGTEITQLDRLLDGVYLDLAPIALDAGADTVAAARAYLELATARGIAATELRGTFGADPVGLQARAGVPAELGALGELAELAGRTSMRVATVDATVYHDAGGSDADELAIATCVGIAYLRALTDAGLAVADALARIEFRFAVTADQFGSIAKLRAARRIWARVAELCGVTDDVQHQHAVTSTAMMTRRDAWVNMLRTTIACFAAAVGGADAVTVQPFDSAIGRSDDFARRIARNTHSVLHDESSLARVVDPGGGSWYLEARTDALAEAAWSIFTDTERGGGALAALSDGTLARLLAGTRDARAADIAHRRAPLTGVSEYAFLEETAVQRPAAPVRGTDGPLPPHRWAEPFEHLRDRAEAAPERPQVFLAALGPVAAHSARAGFAANLFAAGGIRSVTGTGSTEELLAAFEAARTPVVCLCSSDKVYATDAAEVAAALRAAGARHIYLAGKADYPDVDGNLYAGCDALAVLGATFDELGVA